MACARGAAGTWWSLFRVPVEPLGPESRSGQQHTCKQVGINVWRLRYTLESNKATQFAAHGSCGLVYALDQRGS